MNKCLGNYSECKESVSDADAPRDMEPFLTSMMDPQCVIDKSKRIIAAYRLKEPNLLTVGDLSLDKRRRDEREKRHPRMNAQQDGLTVGSLYESPAIPRPFESGSQRALREMQQKQTQKLSEVRKIKKIMRLQQEHGIPFPWETAAILRET